MQTLFYKLMLAFVLLCIIKVCDSADDEDLGELKFLILLTRHGARSPSVKTPKNSTITNDIWSIRFGDLTEIGERQHYLLGKKFSKKFIGNGKFLSDKYDPRQIAVLSTDFNRTLMSAYSELMGYSSSFPTESLTDEQQIHARTPFRFTGETEALLSLGKSPTKYNFTQIPIHDGSIDEMMRGMDADICPIQADLRNQIQGNNTWKDLNKKYQATLFPVMEEKFNADKDTLNFSSAYPYVDNYYSAWFDQMEITNPLTKDEQANITKILRDGLYEGFFSMDLAVRLATSRYFNFLYTTIERKLDSIIDKSNSTRLKFVYLSAHDSTISAIMSGLQQKQDEQVEFASYILTEVYQKPESKGTNYSDFTVRMLYNGKPFSPNGTKTCPDPNCDFIVVKEFLKSREYDGNITEK